ncbi:MAG: hypothetical protein KDB80_09920 [Planctomycetes bacterium]|nr:hypothetical protein [Planctomycetota bacterium]
MNARIAIAAGSTLVLGGGIVGFLMLRAGSEAEARRAEVLRAAEAELESVPPDRVSMGVVLRRVEELEKLEPHPRLTRVRAKLQLALGRTAVAWETIAAVVTVPGSTVEDSWIAACVLARLHAEVGDRARGLQALGFAQECSDSTGDVESTFLAWQLAYRVNDIERWIEFGRRLRDEFGSTLEGETAAAIEHFLGLAMATRLGIDTSPENLQALAGNEDSADTRAALARYLRDTEATWTGLQSSEVERLFRQWGADAPPEFLVVRARNSILRAGQPDGGPAALNAAIEDLEVVLAKFPTSIEARHWISIAHYGLLQIDQQNAHLRWLVENASQQDLRQRSWRERLQ